MVEAKQLLLLGKGLAKDFHGSLDVALEVLEFSDAKHGLEGHWVLLSHDLYFNFESFLAKKEGFRVLAQGEKQIGQFVHCPQGFGMLLSVLLQEAVPDRSLGGLGLAKPIEFLIDSGLGLEGSQRLGMLCSQGLLFSGENLDVALESILEVLGLPEGFHQDLAGAEAVGILLAPSYALLLIDVAGEAFALGEFFTGQVYLGQLLHAAQEQGVVIGPVLILECGEAFRALVLGLLDLADSAMARLIWVRMTSS